MKDLKTIFAGNGKLSVLNKQNQKIMKRYQVKVNFKGEEDCDILVVYAESKFWARVQYETERPIIKNWQYYEFEIIEM